MPQQGNIAQFNSPIESIDTRMGGSAASEIANAGWTEGKLYRQAGEDIKQGAGNLGSAIEEHQYMDEVSQGGAALAAMHSNLSSQWNKIATSSDPNDKSIQEDFLNNTLEPSLEQFQNSFSTQKGQQWALQRVNEMRQSYAETTTADMSSRAGEARVQNTVQQLNQLSTAAYKDPRSADLSFKQLDAVYDAATENSLGMLNVKQVDAIDKLRQDAKNEIVKNAIKGFADSESPDGPTKAKAILDSGSFDQYLPRQEADTLYKYIDNQDQTRQVAAQQKQQAQAWQSNLANEQEVKGIFSQLSSGQPYPATLAFANQKLSTQQKNDLVAKNGILSLPPSFLNSPAYGDNFGQIAKSVYAGQPLTAQALTQGVRRQEITPAGAVQLQELSDKMRTPQGMAEVAAQGKVLQQLESQIVKGGPGSYDPAGQKIYNNMLNSFYPAWDAAIKSGKSPVEIASDKIFTEGLANTFKRSDAQALADVTKATPPAVKQVAPNAADISYLKANPSKAAAFDKTFGLGASAKILGAQ